MLLLIGWLCAALLIGLCSGVTRVDLLLVVPATVMAVCLVTLGAPLLALLLTTWSAVLLAIVTWGPIPGAALTISAALVATKITSFLRPTGRRRNRPTRGLTKGINPHMTSYQPTGRHFLARQVTGNSRSELESRALDRARNFFQDWDITLGVQTDYTPTEIRPGVAGLGPRYQADITVHEVTPKAST